MTGDEAWIHHYDPFSQREAKTYKKLGEKTPTRLRVTRSTGKIITIIFWDCEDVLLIDFLPCGITINGSYYTSLRCWLCSSIGKKRRRKLMRSVLLLYDKTSVHKFNITQATIQYTSFTEFNHPNYIFFRSCTQ